MTTTLRRPLSSLENISGASTGIAKPTVEDNQLEKSIKLSFISTSKYDELRSIVDNYILDPIIATQAKKLISQLQLDAAYMKADKSHIHASSNRGKENNLTKLEAPTEHFISEQLDCVGNHTLKDSLMDVRLVKTVLADNDSSSSKLIHALEQELSYKLEVAAIHVPVDIPLPVVRRSSRRASLSSFTNFDLLQDNVNKCDRKARQPRRRKLAGMENLCTEEISGFQTNAKVVESTYNSPQKSPKLNSTASPSRSESEMPWNSGKRVSVDAMLSYQDPELALSCTRHCETSIVPDFYSENYSCDRKIFDESNLATEFSRNEIESDSSGHQQIFSRDSEILLKDSKSISSPVATEGAPSLIVLKADEDYYGISMIEEIPTVSDSSFEFPILLSALSKIVDPLDSEVQCTKNENFMRNSGSNNDNVFTNGTLFINDDGDVAKSGTLGVALNSTELFYTTQVTDCVMDQNISSLSLQSLTIDGNISKHDLNMIFGGEDSCNVLPLEADIIVEEKGKGRRKKHVEKCSSFTRRSSMRFKSNLDRSLCQTSEGGLLNSPSERCLGLQHHSYEAPGESKSRMTKETARNIFESSTPAIEEFVLLESFTIAKEIQPVEFVLQSIEDQFLLHHSSEIIEAQMELIDYCSLPLNTAGTRVDSSSIKSPREDQNITYSMHQTWNERTEEDFEVISSGILSTGNEINLMLQKTIKSTEMGEMSVSVTSKAAGVSGQVSDIEINVADNDQLRYQELLQWCCGDESVAVQDPYYPHSILPKPAYQEGLQCSSDLTNLEDERCRDDLLATMGRFYSDEENDFIFNSDTIVAESRYSLDSCSSAETVLLAATRPTSLSLPLLQSISFPFLLDLDEIDMCVSEAPIMTMELIDFSILISNIIETPCDRATTEYDVGQLFDATKGVLTEIEHVKDKQITIYSLLERSTTTSALQNFSKFIEECHRNQSNTISTSFSSSSGIGFVIVLLSLLNNFNSCSFSRQDLSSTPPTASCSHQLRDFISFVTTLSTLIPVLQLAEEDIIARDEIPLFDSIEGEKRKKVHFCDIDGSSVETPSHNVSCGSALRTTRRLHSMIGRINDLISLIFFIDSNRENRHNEDFAFLSLLDSVIHCCEQLLLPDSATIAATAMQQSLSLNMNSGDLRVLADIILSELLSVKKVPKNESTDALSSKAVGCSRTVLRHRTGWMATSVIRSQLRWLLDPPPTMLTAKTGKTFSPSSLRSCDIYKMITLKEVVRPSISNKKSLDIDSFSTSKMTLSSLITQAMKQIYDAFISYYSCHIIPIIGSVDAYVTQLLISSLNKCQPSVHSPKGVENIALSFHLQGMECSQPQVILPDIPLFHIE